MNRFDLNPSRIAAAREIFAEFEGAEALLNIPGGVRPKRVAASRLYAAAQAGEDAGADALLGESLSARRFHRRAVAETARFSLAEARAASTGHTAARHGEGCHIRVEQSRAEPDQFFVVVELPRDAAPTSLVVCDSADRCQRFTLPAVRNGVAQFIAERDSDLMRLIGDPATRVYLR